MEAVDQIALQVLNSVQEKIHFKIFGAHWDLSDSFGSDRGVRNQKTSCWNTYRDMLGFVLDHKNENGTGGVFQGILEAHTMKKGGGTA